MAFDSTKLKAKLQAQALQVREQAASFLVDTGYLQRRTGETVVDGQSVTVWAAREEISCRFIAKTGASTTNVSAQYRTTKQTFYYGKAAVQLPYGTEVTSGDLFIYVESNGTEKVYEIAYVPAQHEFMGALVVPLEETT
jgi:hypothetical protein